MEAFSSLAEAKVVIETWRRRYNEEPPHSSLGYLTPTEFRCTIELAQLGLPASGLCPRTPGIHRFGHPRWRQMPRRKRPGHFPWPTPFGASPKRSSRFPALLYPLRRWEPSYHLREAPGQPAISALFFNPTLAFSVGLIQGPDQGGFELFANTAGVAPPAPRSAPRLPPGGLPVPPRAGSAFGLRSPSHQRDQAGGRVPANDS